ncbi:MAG: hypothetical protein SF029_13575 [bacterium]|nr:hypothetical protein [bacterium]
MNADFQYKLDNAYRREMEQRAMQRQVAAQVDTDQPAPFYARLFTLVSVMVAMVLSVN